MVVLGCVVEAEVVAGFAPNKPDVVGWLLVLLNRLEAAAFGSDGGAPAGVVEAKENKGLAGVAAVAVVGVVEVAVAAPLFPNNELPVLANMPDAGAVVVGVPEACAALFWPKRPVVGGADEDAPLKRFDAGLAAVLPEPPKSPPPEAGMALVFPKSPPVAGADEAAGVAEEFPNNPPVDGVVVFGAPKRPVPVAAGDDEELLAAEAPPNRPPAGFAESVFCPNNEPALVAGVVLLPAAVPKENLGVPAAAPNRPPEAGAVVVGLFEAAPDELGAPKLNDMMADMHREAPSTGQNIYRSQRLQDERPQLKHLGVNQWAPG